MKDSEKEDLYLDLKVIAYRKKLEEEKQFKEKLHNEKQLIQEQKHEYFENFLDIGKSSFKSSVMYTLPVGLGGIFAIRSLAILPATVLVGFVGKFGYDFMHQDNLIRYQQALSFDQHKARFCHSANNWKKYNQELNKERSMYDTFWQNFQYPMINDYTTQQQQDLQSSTLQFRERKQNSESYLQFNNTNKFNTSNSKQQQQSKYSSQSSQYPLRTQENSAYLQYLNVKNNTYTSVEEQKQQQKIKAEKEKEFIEKQRALTIQKVVSNNPCLKFFDEQGKSCFWASLGYIGLWTQVLVGSPFPYLFYAVGKALSATGLIGLFIYQGNIIQHHSLGFPVMERSTARNILYTVGCSGYCFQLLPYAQYLDTSMFITTMTVSVVGWKLTYWIGQQVTKKRQLMFQGMLTLQVATLIPFSQSISENLFIWCGINMMMSSGIANDYFAGNPDHLFYSLLYLWVAFSIFQILSKDTLDVKMLEMQAQDSDQIENNNNNSSPNINNQINQNEEKHNEIQNQQTQAEQQPSINNNNLDSNTQKPGEEGTKQSNKE